MQNLVACSLGASNIKPSIQNMFSAFLLMTITTWLHASAYRGNGESGLCSCSSYVPLPSRSTSKVFPKSQENLNLLLYLQFFFGRKVITIGSGYCSLVSCRFSRFAVSVSDASINRWGTILDSL